MKEPAFKTETEPREYKRRGLELIRKIREFQRIWTRISKASEFKADYRETFKTRRDWIDNEIADAWMRMHFYEAEAVLKNKKLEVASAYLAAAEILEALN